MKNLPPVFYVLVIIVGGVAIRVIFIGLRKMMRAMYEVDYAILDYTIQLIEGVICGYRSERRTWPFGGRYIDIIGTYKDKEIICEVVYGFIGMLDEGPCPILKLKINHLKQQEGLKFRYKRPSKNTYLKEGWLIAEIYNYIFLDDLKMRVWPKKFNKDNIVHILEELYTTAKIIDGTPV